MLLPIQNNKFMVFLRLSEYFIWFRPEIIVRILDIARYCLQVEKNRCLLCNE